MQDCFCLFDTKLAAILLANTSSSIKVSGNRAQRNYGYGCDSKTVGAALDWSWLIKATVNCLDRQKTYAVIVSTGKLSTTSHRVLPFNRGIALLECRGLTTYSRRPYTMYYSGNYAIHGTYWHHRFGTPVSHGCINVAVDHARWLFNWTLWHACSRMISLTWT